MNYEFFIALRYFGAKRRTGFISIITIISVVGVVIGVAALDIVLSAFNGFESEVRSRLINADSHISVRRYHEFEIENYADIRDKLLQVEHVKAVTPLLERKAVLRKGPNSEPVLVRAMDMETAGDVTAIPELVKAGEFDLGTREFEGRALPGIVLGRQLAENLHVFSHDLPDGVVVNLFALPRNASIMAQPRVQQFIVTGICEIGYYEYDLTLAITSIPAAQQLFRTKDVVSRLEIKLDDFELAEQIDPIVEELLGGYPYTAWTWFERNRSLYSWMSYEKLLFTIVLSLIILVAAFNIISSLVMIVMEKTREIGILKSMGASSSSIMKIFLFEGVIIGVLGATLGSLLGFTVCWAQQVFGFFSLPAEVYTIDKFPVEMHLVDFAVVSVVGLLLCILASAYPAMKGASLQPVDAIRYE